MVLKTKYLAFMLLLTMLFSGVGCGNNLLIGGINQSDPTDPCTDPSDPSTCPNAEYQTIAHNLGATYIPTYYGESDILLDDIEEVNNAALGIKTDQNGLTNTALNALNDEKKHYDTIIGYSGGTSTVVTAMAEQGVTCDTLILISPMAAAVSHEYLVAALAASTVVGTVTGAAAASATATASTATPAVVATPATVPVAYALGYSAGAAATGVAFGEFANPKADETFEAQIETILEKNPNLKIIVIQSTDDTPAGVLSDLCQYTFKDTWDKSRVEIHNVDLYYTGDKGHTEIFFDYAKYHLMTDTDGDGIVYSSQSLAPSLVNKLSGAESPAWMKSESSSGLKRTQSSEKNPTDTSQSNTQKTSSAAVDAFSADTLQSLATSQEINPTDTSQSDTQETSTAAFDAYSEGRRLAAEGFAETYQSTEPSTDIAQGLEPITQAMESSKSTDESNTKERSIIPTLYPTTSPPLDETNTKESSVIPTLYPTTTPPPNEQENDLPFGSVQETAQQAKQSETKDPTDELDPNLEGKRLAAEAFKETYQSTEQSENADSTSYKSTIPTPTGTADESNTKESSGVTTLYPVTNPPPDESNIKESDLGGVNFTSIKLNCISVSTDSSGGVNFDLILKGQKAERTSPGINIQNATRIGATAFMTGLAVNDNKFWVNLNPWEVGRIIDEELGESEIGRVMLEADLQMKRDFSNYGNPCVNETGKALWSLLDKKREDLVQRCMNKFPGEIKEASNIILKPVQRHWIVPDKAYAYSNGSLIYIINASLTINSEPVTDHSSFQVKNQDIGTLSRGCIEELNRSALDYAEYCKNLEERMIQPYVVADINTNEKYEDLREVYAALALAQWYKSTVTPHTDIFRDRLDSSSSAILKSQTPWHPKDVWDKYVYSFRNGEYKCWENTTTKTAKGTRTKFSLHSAGGVEFEDIRDHFVKIEAIPLEVQDQAKKAITDGFVDSRNEVLFGYRLHVNQKKEAQITNTSRESSIESQNSNQGIEDHLKENRTVNATSLISKKSQNQSCETLSAAKVGGNARRITCPDGWMGPDENGECWQMQITS